MVRCGDAHCLRLLAETWGLALEVEYYVLCDKKVSDNRQTHKACPETGDYLAGHGAQATSSALASLRLYYHSSCKRRQRYESWVQVKHTWLCNGCY